MAICERCNKEFDEDFDEETFSIEYSSFSYSNFSRCLCYDCASEIIENEVDGYYYETCEKCGKTFDYFTENSDFYRNHDENLTEYWNNDILCSDCAEEAIEELENIHNEYYGNEDEEIISVSDAASIWLSHGKDEDYMFGYTEEELEESLH